MKKSVALLLLLIVFGSVVGCKSSSTGPTYGTSAVTPGIGSWYKYLEYERDTTGSIISVDTEIDIVVSTAYTIGSEHDITVLRSSFSGSSDTSDSYLKLKSNGDLEGFSNDPSHPNSIIAPFGTHISQIIPFDTTYRYSGFTNHETGIDSILFSRSDNLKIKGTSFACSVITFSEVSRSEVVDSTQKVTTYTYSTTEEDWFAPALGNLVYFNRLRSKSDGKLNETRETILIDYLLK